MDNSLANIGTMKEEMIQLTNSEYMTVWHAFTRLLWWRELGELGIGENRITLIPNDDMAVVEGRKLTMLFEELIAHPTSAPDIFECVVCKCCGSLSIVPFPGFTEPTPELKGCAFCTDPELMEAV